MLAILPASNGKHGRSNGDEVASNRVRCRRDAVCLGDGDARLSCETDHVGYNVDHVRCNGDQRRCKSDGDIYDRNGWAVVSDQESFNREQDLYAWDHGPCNDDGDTRGRGRTGCNDQPEREGDDLASRVAHIRAALDTLSISRAVLVGHSLGGDEITAFAGAHPGRTTGLFYLDAAIDHVPALESLDVLTELRNQPTPTTADRVSPQALRPYLRRTWGSTTRLARCLR